MDFLGHNAKLGCNKCYKEFSISESHTNAGTSEFDRTYLSCLLIIVLANS